jgi:hypothetical protein
MVALADVNRNMSTIMELIIAVVGVRTLMNPPRGCVQASKGILNTASNAGILRTNRL